MYSIRGDGIVIYQDVSPTESRKAAELKLTLADNAAGTLEISLPPGNAGYVALKHMTSEIIVNKDGEDIWHGRIISERMDFWNNRKLTCEGELAYLNDTTQPPCKYAEGTTIFDFLEKVLENHNSRYDNDERYKFYVGESLIYNEDEPLPEIVTDYNSTLECINQNVTEKFKCHIIIERKDGKKYLKFVKDETKFSENTQVIRFGDNLLDFTRNWDLTDLATVVIPRGKQLEKEADEDSDELNTYVGLGEIPITDVVAKGEFGYYERVGGGSPVKRRNPTTRKWEWYYTQDKSKPLAHVGGDVNDSLIYHYFDAIDEDTGEPIYQYKVVDGYITLETDSDERPTIRVNVAESDEDKKIIEFLEYDDEGEMEIVSKIETDDTYCVVYLKDENGDFYSLKDAYGHIEQVVDFSEAEDSIELLKKTRDYIKDNRFDGMTLEVSAVDMHYLSRSKEPVKMLDRMRCISYPHGMNTLFTVTGLSIQLDKPDSAKYTLEKTMRIGARQSAISDSISVVEAEVESAHSTILTRAKQNADKILREKTNGYVNLVTDTTGGRHSQALVVSSSKDWQRSEHFWVWNVNGLGHYTEYGDESLRPDKADDEPNRSQFDGYALDIGITMDGSIVANRITVGHMSADRVRTGVLMSEKDPVSGQYNVIWSLNAHGDYSLDENNQIIYTPGTGYLEHIEETGEYITAGSLNIRNGSINLGINKFSVDNSGTVYAEKGVIGGFILEPYGIHNDKMLLNDTGVHYYVQKSSGLRTEVGYVGSSYWNEHSDSRLISMNLNAGSAAISWGYDDGSSGADYTVKLMYVANGGFSSSNGYTYKNDTLYVLCDMVVCEDIDLHNHKANNFWIDPSSGGASGSVDGRDTTFLLIASNALNDDGTIDKSKTSKIKIKNGFVMPSS